MMCFKIHSMQRNCICCIQIDARSKIQFRNSIRELMCRMRDPNYSSRIVCIISGVNHSLLLVWTEWMNKMFAEQSIYSRSSSTSLSLHSKITCQTDGLILRMPNSQRGIVMIIFVNAIISGQCKDDRVWAYLSNDLREINVHCMDQSSFWLLL